VTYAREGFSRAPFRVVKIAPGPNFRTAIIRAQFHDDTWYSDPTGITVPGIAPQTSYLVGVPRPILGSTLDSSGALEFGVAESSSQAQDGTISLLANVACAVPPNLPLGAPDPPLVSLTPTVSATGGTLAANSVFYYAVTSVDSAGVESAASFTVHAITNSGPSTYSVTLNNISLPASTTGFNVYRGQTPSAMSRIVSNQSPAAAFIDTGFANAPQVAPDPNFDHSNFYWRMESAPVTAVTLYSSTSIGNSSSQLQTDQFKGMTVRITAGTGAGQERVITGNSATTLFISPAWTITPDSTTAYVVSQTGYQFGASGSSSQAQFEIPNLAGQTVQICGRSANAYDIESPYEQATVTRWTINGAGGGALDSGVPPVPSFGLAVLPEFGGVQLSNLTFGTTTNTRTISLGTLTLYYYNEGATAALPMLTNGVGATDSTIAITSASPFTFPSYLALGSEIIRLTGKTPDGGQFTVDRGLDTTTPSAHAAQSVALPLKQMTSTVPFADNFFYSDANANWSQSIAIANARICSAELYCTNSRGNSPVAAQAFTSLADGGLRTLSGGQITLQIPGSLAVQNSAVPPLDPGATYAVNDVYAYVGTPPAGTVAIALTVTVQGQTYCTLSIAPGSSHSTSIDGSTLAALQAGQQIGLNVTAVGDSTPGSDLTVVIRV
jgi:hypothetical protein